MIDHINDCPFPPNEKIQEVVNYNIVNNVKKKITFPKRVSGAPYKNQTPRLRKSGSREPAPTFLEKVTAELKSFGDALDEINETLEEEIALTREEGKKRIIESWMALAKKGYYTEEQAMECAQEAIKRIIEVGK